MRDAGMQTSGMPKRDTEAASPLHGDLHYRKKADRMRRHDGNPTVRAAPRGLARAATAGEQRAGSPPVDRARRAVATSPFRNRGYDRVMPSSADRAARNASAARSCSIVHGRDVSAPPLLPRFADTPLVSTLPGKYHCPLRGCALQSWTINARPFVTARPFADAAARRADGIRLSEDSLPRPPYPCFQKP